MSRCPPIAVQDMEVNMIHIWPGFRVADVGDDTLSVALDLPDRPWSAPDQDHKNAFDVGMLCQVCLGDFVLACSRRAEDHWDDARLGEGSHAAGKAARQTHQVSVVQAVVATHQPTPPNPESTWTLGQRKIGVQHDAVHAIILAIEKIAAILAE